MIGGYHYFQKHPFVYLKDPYKTSLFRWHPGFFLVETDMKNVSRGLLQTVEMMMRIHNMYICNIVCNIIYNVQYTYIMCILCICEPSKRDDLFENRWQSWKSNISNVPEEKLKKQEDVVNIKK